jgi:hypothetical protein
MTRERSFFAVGNNANVNEDDEMATNKKPNPKTLSGSIAKAEAEATTKPTLTLAAETAAILESVLPGRSAPVEVPQPSAATGSAAPVTETPPPAVARILDGPVESVVAKVFESSPDKEFTVNAVIAELKLADPGINENSIRYTITELKRKSVIHHVRNQGHHQILKFTKAGEERSFPKDPLLDKPGTKSALRTSPADVASDLAVLKEATAVITRLQALVHRNQEILTHISKLKAVL